MLKKSFKSKIILPTIIVLIVLTAVLTVFISVKFLSYSNKLIDQKVIADTNSLRLHVNNGRSYSKTAAVSMACNPEVIKAVKSRDRAEILRVSAFALELYQINFFTVTDENGIVLARTHAPDTFGDSLTNQQGIKNALDGKVSTYFEAGTVVKVSVRTGAPVRDADGTLIGVVSTGVRFDTNEVVDELKELFHSDVTVCLGDTMLATTLRRHGQRINGTKIDPHIARIVIDQKKEFAGDSNVFSVPYKTFYMPLIDANDVAFATFVIATPMSELRAEANALVRNTVLISFTGLAIACVILYVVMTSISKPLIMLAQEMDELQEGRLSIIINAQSDDEIGHAGKSLQKVVDILHKLIDDINVAISEHEKGNTDYLLDTSNFRGDYQLLADRIMELSRLGMRDQMTGIPNRRSFDYRLDLEWNRALRDKTPLSLLMIDVDRFKTYNDTCGHQQGDLVLQTVAKTLMLPIKRGVDFVARWGGEEFVVLLPNTDSGGALHVAEIIRATIEGAEIPSTGGGSAKKVTISIGTNTLVPTPEKSIEKLVSQADEALYRAKATGRNRVCPYEDGE